MCINILLRVLHFFCSFAKHLKSEINFVPISSQLISYNLNINACENLNSPNNDPSHHFKYSSNLNDPPKYI